MGNYGVTSNRIIPIALPSPTIPLTPGSYAKTNYEKSIYLQMYQHSTYPCLCIYIYIIIRASTYLCITRDWIVCTAGCAVQQYINTSTIYTLSRHYARASARLHACLFLIQSPWLCIRTRIVAINWQFYCQRLLFYFLAVRWCGDHLSQRPAQHMLTGDCSYSVAWHLNVAFAKLCPRN